MHLEGASTETASPSDPKTVWLYTYTFDVPGRRTSYPCELITNTKQSQGSEHAKTFR
ncbi:hypothetical protein DPMN_114950 [Dreissena polymorpha]|uniref:Uncharacterized protein n=1 Tax=Dreissena polymorpha TaxID=45954 RepID=A0A9D4QS12_DREPO|nr:hypothetical protein DPMN_114950 [Dreissena polymorpha]